MSDYHIEIAGVFAVSAPSFEELQKLVSQARELRDEFGGARVHRGHGGMVPSVAGTSTPNADKCSALNGGKRFRMTREERAEYGEGDQAREKAAIARLCAMGEEVIGGSATGNVGAVQGETWNGTLEPFAPSSDEE